MADGDDLSELFPDLADVLSRWQAPIANNTPAPGEQPAVTDDQLAAFEATHPAPVQQFGNGSTLPPTGGVEDAAGGLAPTSAPPSAATPPPEATPQTPPTVTAPAPEVTPPSPTIDPARTAQLAQLQEELAANPELRTLIADYYARQIQPPSPAAPPVLPQHVAPQPTAQGQYVPPPATPPLAAAPQPGVAPLPSSGATPALTADDLDDPAIRALYELNQAQAAQLANLQQFVNGQAQLQQTQMQTSLRSMAEKAQAEFATKHSLDANEIEQLTAIAARLNVLPALMSGMDPQTGLPSRPDPLVAVDRALEIAMFADPDFRSKELQRQVKTAHDERQRKQRLGAVSGSSGSVPRTSPQAPQDSRGNMLREVADMLRGDWSEPVSN